MSCTHAILANRQQLWLRLQLNLHGLWLQGCRLTLVCQRLLWLALYLLWHWLQ